jgi:catechol 2,3-dioxygenase-like lactoylglutathione lyase family enzyme
MKRFHVHVAVNDLAASIRFYSTIFGHGPAVEKPDYAKWMLEDPRVNFAISLQGEGRSGLDHLGFQVDSTEALSGLQTQLAAADAGLFAEQNATCCYARSDKYWVTDPTGIAWETFHTLGAAPVYGVDRRQTADAAPDTAACCAPTIPMSTGHAAIPVSAAACCGPAATAEQAPNASGCSG